MLITLNSSTVLKRLESDSLNSHVFHLNHTFSVPLDKTDVGVGLHTSSVSDVPEICQILLCKLLDDLIISERFNLNHSRANVSCDQTVVMVMFKYILTGLATSELVY